MLIGKPIKNYPKAGTIVKESFYFGNRLIEKGSVITINTETRDFGFIGWKDTQGIAHLAKW